jgi:hypothetical protein
MDRDSAEHCRIQADECRRLLALSENEAEALALKYLARSWIRLPIKLTDTSRSGKGAA